MIEGYGNGVMGTEKSEKLATNLRITLNLVKLDLLFRQNSDVLSLPSWQKKYFVLKKPIFDNLRETLTYENILENPITLDCTTISGGFFPLARGISFGFDPNGKQYR